MYRRTVAPEIWQSAILSRFLRSPDRSRFDAEATLDWLDCERLLKLTFRRLLGGFVRITGIAGCEAASALVPSYRGADMVRASPLARGGNFLLRLASC